MLLKSPFNYTGNKYKLLPQLLPLFPTQIDTFHDIFCGGCAVGTNVNAQAVRLYDLYPTVPTILQWFLSCKDGDEVLYWVDTCIKAYDLTVDNLAGYEKLREDYNNRTNEEPVALLTLILHAYNSIIRFNQDGQYNAPFGYNNSWLNPARRKVLKDFVDHLHTRKYTVEIADCENSLHAIRNYAGNHQQDFVYCDPPYLITQAVYNADWDVSDEYRLYTALGALDALGVKFGLSNVLYHNGKVNTILANWMKHYHVHEINMDYKRTFVNKRALNKKFTTTEVFVCNYTTKGE